MAWRPLVSYTVWFTQRNGSTMLCKALEETGVVGRPGEQFNGVEPEELIISYGVDTPAQLQEKLWETGSTPNGVFGLKHGIYESHFTRLLAQLRRFPGGERLDEQNRPAIWENAFPNHRHIFLTRRNKVRLAVSWWKAIQSQEWHREHGAKPTGLDVADHYDFAAIDTLVSESVMREAATQEFLAEAGVIPLMIAYEDLVRDHAGTIRAILSFLGAPENNVGIKPPHFERLADEVSEEWVQGERTKIYIDTAFRCRAGEYVNSLEILIGK